MLDWRASLPLIHQRMAGSTAWIARERRTVEAHRAILTAIRAASRAGNAGKAIRLPREHFLKS